ncbi:sulfite exporter TauE/SafE family protein|uniref:Probable membrane transporter protein n=1 Tax=Dendrosporobacter quercicolus TaxID=146817 RepID=A0A1G9LQ56_9FIRM|nr:sulfite exporter TauE/SafE family protein [Dendrosporobacter quercicolus]NSL46793.1 sulfite exporter TauE/SafE family protein [Dendrosporobacter quercicolus DSM 1736]SDL64058.1 hypothetical protein SAMN04488502_101432 [Dendrosporobacter quercicolus]
MMILIFLLIGLISGVLSGMLGVGGGLILIPSMVLLAGFSQHMAQGISLLVIIPTALAGVWRLNKDHLIDLRLALPLAAGSVIGTLVSANFIQSLPSSQLRIIFGVFVVATGIKTLVNARKKQRVAESDE